MKKQAGWIALFLALLLASCGGESPPAPVPPGGCQANWDALVWDACPWG